MIRKIVLIQESEIEETKTKEIKTKETEITKEIKIKEHTEDETEDKIEKKPEKEAIERKSNLWGISFLGTKVSFRSRYSILCGLGNNKMIFYRI